MALSLEAQRSFHLYVTHVDGEGHFLKISGQLDQQSSLMVESLFASARENLDKGIGVVRPAAIQDGVICAAKYKDDNYYRAKIINTNNLRKDIVEVYFIDYGNKDIITPSSIRFLDSYDPKFLQLPGQATDYYLSRVIHPSGMWEESILIQLQSLLCYAEYPASVEAQTRTLPIISIEFKGSDLSTHLVSNRFGIALPALDVQEILINHNFLNISNPASSMLFNQNVSVHAPSSVATAAPMAPPSAITNKPPSTKKSITYKSRLLEVNSQHKVFVSFAEEGPELFAVQLVSDATKIQNMMDDINKRPHSSLAEPPVVGTVCLGRNSGDRMICRASVMDVSGSQCKLFFVDFGDREMVSYYDIFDIPVEFVKPNIFAMRFCLSGVKKLEKSPHLNAAFKQLVSGKVLTLRVVSPEGPPLIQYAELFLGNKSVLDLLIANMKEKLQFKWMKMLPLSSRHSVLVSYVDSCMKFYVQLSDNIDNLKAVMAAVKTHCENTLSPGQLPVGAVCCARFPDDDNWYRAMVMVSRGKKVVVIYVDYGNKQEVDITDLRTITPDLIRLPAQAMKCALKGFENKPIETETSKKLEMLALEKTLMAHIVGVLSSDTMLVTLIDDTVTPPLDVAKKMNQLSQPRSNTIEAKVTTPLREDAPETISSPEGSVQDDKKKNFRRENSFKEEKRKDGENFGLRGSSLRGQDNSYTQDEDSRGDDRWNRGFRLERTDHRGERRENWNKTRVFRNNRADRVERQAEGRSKFKELSDPLPLETPFTEPSLEIGSQQEVVVTWINSPENFYSQILSLRPKFLEMMNKIPALYKGVRSYYGNVSIGASVLARYPEDGALYRATIISVQPFSKFIVHYVDFGNKQLVDSKDIWQMERELMELPKLAVHCCLSGVVPKTGKWKADPEIDHCFNAPRYQCVFQECVEDEYKVSLWNNGVSVADLLVEKGLAVMSESQTDVTLQDEAIDLKIIVGQKIMCRVTHVESFEKFFVQLDLDKADLVENAINSYDVAKLTPLAADSLMEGMHCTVKNNDKVYRAILSDVSDTNNIEAVVPDYGNTITTTLDKLLNLPTELTIYYYQSLQCSLNNYTEESKTLLSLDDFKKRLTGSKFIIYVNYIEGITLVSTLYEGVTGQKIAIFEPDEGSFDEVVPLCTRAVFNYNFGKAYISHIENLNEFYLQKSSDGDKIAELLEQLYKFYEEGTPEALTEFEADGLCVAKSSDGNWYRATILSSTQNCVKVQFPDYGNSEIVPKEALKKLDPKFYEPCYLALVASLGLTSLQKDAVSKVMEWTTEQELQVTLAFGNDGWLANLHLDGVDLSMKLINENLATTQIISEIIPEEPKPDAPIEEPISLPEGCTQLYSSYIDTPGHFWLQMLDKVQKIDEGHATTSEETECGDLPSCFASHVNSPSEFCIQLETAAPELQSMEAAMVDAESFPELTEKEEGVLCAAKYPEDDAWYRAQVIFDYSEGTEVFFIDYGNTSITNELRSLPDELKLKPALSRKCALQKPRDIKSWSRKSVIKFNELAAEGATIFKVQFIARGDISIVELYLDGKSVTEELVGLCEEHPASERPTPVAQNLHSSGKICYVHSLEEFYVHLYDSIPGLDKITDKLSECSQFEPISKLKVGSIYAAFSSKDEQWYRSRILEFCDVGYHVQFIDYGNKAKCEEFRQLPEDIAMIEPLATCCRLAGFTGDVSNESAKSKLEDLVAELVTFQIEFLDRFKEPSLVKLLLNGTDLSSVLKMDTPHLVDETEPIAEKEKTINEYDNENPSQGLNSSQQDSNESISSHSTVIKALDVEKYNSNKCTTSIEEEKDNVNNSITSLEEEKDNSNKSITSLEGEKDISNESTTSLEREKDNLSKSITSLEEENDYSNNSITSLEGEHDISNKSTTSLEEEKDNSNNSITSLEGEKDKSNKSITSLEGGKDNSNKSITSVEEEKDNANNSITSLEEEKDNSNKSITSSEGKKDISNESTTSLEGEKENLNKSITSLEEEKDNLNKSITSLEGEKHNSNKSTTSIEEEKKNTSNESNQDKVITPEKNVDNLESSNGQSIAPEEEAPKEQLNNVKDSSSEEHVESVEETASLDKKLVSQGDEKPVEVV